MLRQRTLTNIFSSKIFLSQVIPAERRMPEREETWTLAPDQHDPCSFFDDISDVKSKPVHDVDPTQSRIVGDTGETGEHPEGGTLPRSQETRKSKTKKVKSYLRKCKGALSKGDEASSDKKRHEHCTSWYLDESHQEDLDVLLQKQSEYLDDRIVEAQEASNLIPDETLEDTPLPIDTLPTTDPLTNPTKEDDRDDPDDEALTRLTEDESNETSDLRRSRTSVYEDARDCINDRECAVEESCVSDKPERNDAVSLETLTTEDTNLNKCDSNDTLIAEVAASGPDSPSLVDVEEGKEEETRDQEVDGETPNALSLLGVSRLFDNTVIFDCTLCLLAFARSCDRRWTNIGITHNARFLPIAGPIASIRDGGCIESNGTTGVEGTEKERAASIWIQTTNGCRVCERARARR